MQLTARSPQPSAAASLALVLGLTAALALAPGCRTPQRWPGPMPATVDPLPEGDKGTYIPGPEEVEVIRHGDPVMIRRAGSAAGFPKTFYDKRERVNSGAWVLTGPGGLAELTWPLDGTSIALFDQCVVVVGEPSRDEPTAVFRSLSQAQLDLTPEDRISIARGAILRGSDDAHSGPFHLRALRGGEIVRLVNRSQSSCTVSYRDEELVISPSQLVDLPLLPGGARPEELLPGTERLDVDGFRVTGRGEYQAQRLEGGLEVLGDGPSTLTALGVKVELGAGERAVFNGLEGPWPAVQSASELPAEGHGDQTTPASGSPR